MFVTLQYLDERADLLNDSPQATRSEQLRMLGAFLNTAHAALANWAQVEAQCEAQGVAPESLGLTKPNLPLVEVTYRKVTRAKPRIAGEHYRETPGREAVVHTGPVVKVDRNKVRQVYFTIADSNRRPVSDEEEAEPRIGFTAVKIEGLLSFGFADPFVQAKFLKEAKRLEREASA